MLTLARRLYYSALNGDVITERHVRCCRKYGHATHTVDGVASPICPRCGDARESAQPATETLEQARKLYALWADALQKSIDLDATDEDIQAEDAAYDRLVDYIETNGLNYTTYDPRN